MSCDMSGPDLSIETPQENQVFEITYDGHEIHQPPLSMSENLAKLASRMDWSRDGEEAVPDDDSAAATTTADQTTPSSPAEPQQPATWPWETVRNKIREAFTEVSVLSDILSIARHKRYMVLDGVTQDPPDPKPLVQVISKKKALAAAAQTLSEGAERMRESLNEQKRSRSLGDFYTELLRLRQGWRLRKVGNNIIGDLSYKQVGSRFWLPGTFEVGKSEETECARPAAGVNPSSSPAPAPLTVTVPSELQGTAYIYVIVRKDQETLCSAQASLHPAPPAAATAGAQQLHWRDRLEAAQNVLFCRELISQLGREAVHQLSGQPHLVVGNQITSQVFPGIQLVIGLAHSGQTAAAAAGGQQEARSAGSPLGDNNYVLEHSLHQLLRDVHHSNMHRATPHPASAPLGPSKRRRLAGPGAMSRAHLTKLVNSETILERIIRQARHVVLRKRTAFVIDSCAREVRDPLIVTHWNSINSPTQSCCKVNIMTHGYDSVHRTTFLINVLEDTLRCVCRDGRVLTLGYESSELHYTILSQVSQHNMLAAQSLARILGWTVRSSCGWQPAAGGVTSSAAGGGGCSCQLVSPSGERSVLVQCRPCMEEPVQVSVTESPRPDFYPTALLADHKWQHLPANAKQVKWHLMEGRNFLNKLELLLASLSTVSPALL